MRNSSGQFVKGSGLGVKNSRWSGGKVDIPCDFCGAIKNRYVTRKAQKHYFCNPRCKGDWQKNDESFRGEGNPRWKGGIVYDKNGYRMINIPSHHRAHHNGYVYEHILVAEKKFGRKITRDYHVHHLNGVRDDNRPENLDVVLPEDHERGTVRKIYQRRIIELEKRLMDLYGDGWYQE